MSWSGLISKICTLLLALFSLLIAAILSVGITPWALIFTYWLILACKNFCECYKD